MLVGLFCCRIFQLQQIYSLKSIQNSVNTKLKFDIDGINDETLPDSEDEDENNKNKDDKNKDNKNKD